jgi:serpin B
MSYRLIARRSAAVLLLGALGACTSPTEGERAQPVITRLPRALSGDEQVAATATTAFGLALFRQVNATTARDSNLTLSPISASLALGMLLNGAEGETADQIRSTLGFGTRATPAINEAYRTLVPLLTTVDPSVRMQFANAAWFDTGMSPSPTFTQALQATFGAQANVVPFSAPSTVTTINSWVKTNTNGRIQTIVNRLEPELVALLINATYFKGTWRAQFDRSATQSAPFFVTPSVPLNVPTMRTEAGLVRGGQLPDGTVVAELPYGGDAFVMDIVMPPAGRLESAIDSLTPTRWATLLRTLPDSAATTLVSLPKFRLELSRELKPALGVMGMPRAFGGSAQLAPMFAAPDGRLTVSSVLQRVFVDVNEEGTEAAAVTAVSVGVTSVGPVGMIINRPFLFVIRERLSGAILFVGKVIRPSAPPA